MTTPTIPSRRQFLAAGSSAAAFLLTSPGTAFTASANEKIRVGFVGCGGRGTFVGDIFAEDGGFQITAAADYFPDRVAAFGEKFAVPPASRFTGLDGFKKLLAADLVDAVAVHSPPYFHPEHVAAAIDAGKHVLVAKPIAVDVPGIRSVEASARAASANDLSLLVDVQSRGDVHFQECIRRIHEENAIGEFCYGRCIYEYGALQPQAEDDGSPEARLRNWVFEIPYSGDIITEQNIHALDIFAWALGAPALAYGSSGRKVRLTPGDTSDFYAVSFEFPNGGVVSFTSRQYSAWGAPGAITNELFGTRGALFTNFGGNVMIRGDKENFFRGGKTPDLYKSGSVANVAQFRKSILSGKSDTSTVPGAVQTTLVTTLGRKAGSSLSPVTWESIAADTESLSPKGLADLNP